MCGVGLPVNSRALRSQGALFMPLAGPFTLHEMLCKHMPHQSANKMVYIHLQFVLLAGPTRSAQWLQKINVHLARLAGRAKNKGPKRVNNGRGGLSVLAGAVVAGAWAGSLGSLVSGTGVEGPESGDNWILMKGRNGGASHSIKIHAKCFEVHERGALYKLEHG